MARRVSAAHPPVSPFPARRVDRAHADLRLPPGAFGGTAKPLRAAISSLRPLLGGGAADTPFVSTIAAGIELCAGVDEVCAGIELLVKTAA